MKYSNLLIPTLKEAPSDAELISHKLMIKAGLIRKLAAGIYTLLPLGLLVTKRLEAIIREEMFKAGAQEVMMPCIQPSELWQESRRWDQYGKELLRIKDRHNREFCFGPTHEEVVTDIVRNEIKSYRQLPVNLFQIQTKFRDEIRPRFGLMRGREFLMKDGYSFDKDEKGAEESYRKMYEAYVNIFTRCGLIFKIVEAETGEIGGSFSHEFMVLADSGEETVVSCVKCSYSANIERAEVEDDIRVITQGDKCPKCRSKLNFNKGIEVAHIFKLGDKYSRTMDATFLDASGKTQYFVMGCYGIGIGRTIASAIEQNHDENGIIWPLPLSPFNVIIIPVQSNDQLVMEEAWNIYNKLTNHGISTLIDDREERPGVKFKDADLLGIPFQIIIGSKNIKEGKVEIKTRKDNNRFIKGLNEIVDNTLLFNKTGCQGVEKHL